MYTLKFDEKTYELTENNCEDFIMDEEYKIEGVSVKSILNLLNEAENISFDREYYSEHCSSCKEEDIVKSKFYEYLGYSFYIFTKDSKYVESNISKSYKDSSFGRLYRSNVVDNSFIVNIIFCEKCNKYTIEIEQCDM
ncbi:DUF3785 family protein [Clostridium intestinale]|uniref:DUF3785 family protein n=1 Tax=Clostridium intestinale TaxID=36845 RepID=UPI0028E5664E|nr:DUF3785 family protein [Clostridium intestinale]